MGILIQTFINSLGGEDVQNKEIIRLKGQINKMQEKINKLKRRKRELKRMPPSGSGDQGTYCSCKKKREKMSNSRSIKQSRRNVFYGSKRKIYFLQKYQAKRKMRRAVMLKQIEQSILQKCIRKKARQDYVLGQQHYDKQRKANLADKHYCKAHLQKQQLNTNCNQ